MTSPGCPYCQRRLRRRHEPTCGTQGCIDRHVEKQAALAELAALGEAPASEKRRYEYRCGGCGHEQDDDVGCEACGSWDVTARISSTPPASSAGGVVSAVAASVGLDERTVGLVFELERVLRGKERSVQHQALAAALWRSLSQNADLARSESLFVTSVTLRDGGRRISFEAEVLPPLSGGKRA